MRNANTTYSFTERLMVVAILLLVAAVATQNLRQSVRQSEENTMNSAGEEYKAMKSMYAETSAVPRSTLIRATPSVTESGKNSQTN